MKEYMLEASGDTRDRSREIEERLKKDGICILGMGTFYVSGITMPDSTTLRGMGEGSVIYLLDEVEEGYAVKLASKCRLQDLTLKGAEKELPYPESVGKRHGVGFLGHATTKDWDNEHKYGIVTCLHIYAFSGGGITCRDTGYSIDSSLTVSDCRIHHCGVGINIPHYSEYHKFTNVLCTNNCYGCINNGGNNSFTACSFDFNRTAFLMDNSDGQANNDSHGTVCGCTFNHSGNNEGIGIRVVGMKNGYMFVGCQLFFSKICVENSAGVQFVNFNCGRKEKISVKGQGLVLFTNCAFTNQPVIEIEDNDHVHFRNCYTRSGEAINICSFENNMI